MTPSPFAAALRSLRDNSSYLLTARIVEGISRGLYAVVLARVFGSELYGLFNVGLSWYLAFLPLGVWGMDLLLSREIGRDRDSGRSMVRLTLIARLALGLPVTAACLGMAMLIDRGDAGLHIALLLSLALAGRSLAMWANEVFNAYELSRYTLLVQTPWRILEILCGTGLLLLGGGIWEVVATHVASWWLQAATGLLVVHRRISGFGFGERLAQIPPMLRRMLPLVTLGLINAWMLQGPIILARWGGMHADALGQLALALQIYLLAVMIVAALATAALPVISGLNSRGREEDRRLALWMMRLGILFAATAALTAETIGPGLTQWLFGKDYAGAGDLMGPAFWLLMPTLAVTGLNQVLLAERRDHLLMLSRLAGLSVMVMVFPFALAWLGTIGALLAALAGRIVETGIVYQGMCRLAPATDAAELSRPLLALVAGAACFYLTEGLLNAASALPLSLVLLLTLNYLLVLGPRGRRRLRARLRELPKPRR